MSNSPQIKKRKQTDPEENLLEINKIYRKINAIIQSNIPHYKNFEITQSDMNVFSYFIRTTPNFINNISCIVTSPHKLIIHEHNERNKLLLKQLILLMTYVFYNKNYTFDYYQAIFLIVDKLYTEEYLMNDDVIFYFKFSIILSMINQKSNSYSRKDKPILCYPLFYLVISHLLQLFKTNFSIKNYDSIFNEINYFILSIITNFNSKNKLGINTNLLSLISTAVPSIRESCLKMLTHFYSFHYNTFFLEVFLKNIKEALRHIEISTDKAKKIIHKLQIIQSQCELITNINNDEKDILTEDPFHLYESFTFNNSPNNGIDYLFNSDFMKKRFMLIFSFNLFVMNQNTQYPILSFSEEEKGTNMIKVYVQDSYMYVSAKNTKWINYPISINRTYLVIFEYEKGTMKFRINDNFIESINNKIDTFSKCLLRIGYEKLPEMNNNFIGNIGTVILIKRLVGDDFCHRVFSLKGHYTRMLLLCQKTFSIFQHNRFIDAPLAKNKKDINESIEFFFNYLSNTIEVVFNISPFAIMQKGNSDGDEFKYKENIFYRSSKEMNLSTSYSLKECPLQGTHSCTYPMISYRLIENYLKYEGIEMITLIFEYVYTLSRNNHDIPEEIKKEISNCVLSAMKLLYVCIYEGNYDYYKEKYEANGFSISKMVSMLKDRNILNDDIRIQLIKIFEVLITKKSKEQNDLPCRFFSFLCDDNLYDMSKCKVIELLFKTLTSFIRINENIISSFSITKLLSFRFLLDEEEYGKYIHRKVDKNELEYKSMRRQYRESLKIFVSKIKLTPVLFDFFKAIFDNNRDNNSFISTSQKVKYRLLKSYYLSRKENSIMINNTSSISQISENSFGSQTKSKSKKSKKKEDESLHNNELLDKYTSILSNYKSEASKFDYFTEMSKALLIQLIYEETYHIGSEGNVPNDNSISNSSIDNANINNSNVSTNSANQIAPKNRTIIFSTSRSTNTHKSSSLSDSSFCPSKQNTHSIPTNSEFIMNIDIFTPISFIVVKSVFCCIYDGNWGQKIKVSFIKNKGDINDIIMKHDFALDEFGRLRKETLLQYINVIVQIKDIDTLFNGIRLLISLIDSSIRMYEKNDNLRCPFQHILESHSIMNRVISYFLNYNKQTDPLAAKIITSGNPSSLINDKILYFCKYTVIYHDNPFIFSSMKQLLKGQVLESLSMIIKALAQEFIDHNMAYIKKQMLNKKNNIQEGKKVYIFQNESRFLLTLKKLFSINSEVMCKMISEDKELETKITNLLETIVNSSVVYDNNIYKRIKEEKKKLKRNSKSTTMIISSFSLKRKTKKHLIHKTILENVIDLIFIIAITMKKTIEEVNALLCKLIIGNHSICFFVDLYNKNFNFNKELRKKYQFEIPNSEEVNHYSPLVSNYKEKTISAETNLKLMTVITYIKCIEYATMLKNNDCNIDVRYCFDLTSKLEMDISELLFIIEKFPKGHIENDIIYDGVKSALIKSKNNSNFTKIEEIIMNNLEDRNDISLNVFGINCNKVFHENVNIDEYDRKRNSFSNCPNNCGGINAVNATNNNVISTSGNENNTSIVLLEKNNNKNYSLFDFDNELCVICLKRDMLLKQFGYFFIDDYYKNKKFNLLKKQFKYVFPPKDITNGYQNQDYLMNLSYPSTIRNYSFYDTFYPKMFLRPNINFFSHELFRIGHQYFIDSQNAHDYKIKPFHSLINQPSFNLFSETNTLFPFISKNTSYFDCEYCNNQHTYYGRMAIIGNDYKYLVFQTTLPFDAKKEYTSKKKFIYASLEIDVTPEPKQVIIKVSKIRQMVKRRFVYRYQAIEIFCDDGKSYFFNFLDINVLGSFISTLKLDCIIDIDTLYQDAIEADRQWRYNKITSVNYLLQLNRLASRSYNDINQYPIFPWIVYGFQTKKLDEVYRDMEYPISVQLEEKREKAKSRFINAITKHKCHFQIHYSNSSFVNTYLVRMSPFTYNQIRFQVNQFDKPNRQFNSFDEFVYLLQEIFDNRELIPEMYIMIEHFLNLNFVDFGRRTNDHGLINNIAGNELGKNAIQFVLKHKEILNHKKVKENLHKWIDNIFGVNQYNPTVDSLNVYPAESYSQLMLPKFEKYERKYEENKDESELVRKTKGKCYSIISLGQTPKQIFENPIVNAKIRSQDEQNDEAEEIGKDIHEKKLLIQKMKCQTILYISLTSKNSFLYLLTQNELLKVSIASFKIIDEYTIEPIQPLNQFIFSYTKNKKQNSFDFSIYKYYICDLNDGQFFLTCSHYFNLIKVYGNKSLVMNIFTESYVTCIRRDLKEPKFYTGHTNGKIIEWEYSTVPIQKGDNILNVTIKKNMIAHYSSVVLIEINSRHRLIISYGEEGTIIMRKQSTFEVMNVYRVINDNIVSDICFNEDDLIYITLYDPTRMLFTIYGATINFLIFQKIKHSSFLPIQFENVKNEIIYTNGDEIFVLTKELSGKKELKKISKIKKETKSKNNKEDIYEGITSFVYNRSNGVIYCILATNELVRFSLLEKEG